MGEKAILSDRDKGQAGMHDWYWGLRLGLLSYTPIYYKSNHIYYCHIGMPHSAHTL